MLIGRDDKSRPTPSSPLLPDRLTYQEALDFISKQGRFAMKLGTERTRAILDRLGAPDRGLKGALIAGTNGKGSTGACLTAILRAAGHRVGFMPKPHLISYTERIEVDGHPICEDEFVSTLEELMPTLEAVASEMGPATEFEMLTAMALAYLAPRADRLVCEVGLGGRLDATNALDLAVAAAHQLDDLDEEAIREGLAATRWPGRLQVIARRPRVILDGGHNPAAMVKAGVSLRRLIGSERLVAVFAMLSERDPVELLGALRTLKPDSVVCTEPESAQGHAISAERLASIYGPGAHAERPAGAALEAAKGLAGASGNVLVCGSLYLVGEVLSLRDQRAKI